MKHKKDFFENKLRGNNDEHFLLSFTSKVKYFEDPQPVLMQEYKKIKIQCQT